MKVREVCSSENQTSLLACLFPTFAPAHSPQRLRSCLHDSNNPSKRRTLHSKRATLFFFCPVFSRSLCSSEFSSSAPGFAAKFAGKMLSLRRIHTARGSPAKYIPDPFASQRPQGTARSVHVAENVSTNIFSYQNQLRFPLLSLRARSTLKHTLAHFGVCVILAGDQATATFNCANLTTTIESGTKRRSKTSNTIIR